VFNLLLKWPLAAAGSLLLAGGFLISSLVYAKSLTRQNVNVQLSLDLYKDAQLAKQKGVPIVVMFSQDGCLYCSIVRENFLKPLLINRDYDQKVLIREVKVDSFEDIKHFNGKMVGSDELATEYRAYLTPTVIVFDSTGKAHHRIVGLVNEHYYSAELDTAIDNTLINIHQVVSN